MDNYNKYKFEPGKVLVDLNKNCTYPDIPTNHDHPIFAGIEVEKVEILFAPQNQTKTDIGAVLLIQLKSKKKKAVVDAIKKLMANPLVVYAEPDYYMNTYIIPNDPYYGYLWGMDNIKAPLAWDHITGSSEIVIGVVDSGIDYNHPDLNNNMWIAPANQGIFGWDFYRNNRDPMDRTGHGTHVAGTIGAIGNNLIGVTGVCWDIKLAALKIGGNSNRVETAAAIKAIDYSNKNNIPILNNSWGGRAYSVSLKFAIENYNGLFIAAAGNNGSNNDRIPTYPASYTSDNIISVAAINQNNNLTSFSNYGFASVDIAAPGFSILSTILNGGYGYKNGTSMAAPHVAGAAALLKVYRPDLTSLEIKEIILSGVDKQPGLSGRILSEGTLNLNKMIGCIVER